MKEISIYIHIPFCKSKCYYCNFYSIPLIKTEYKTDNGLPFDYYFKDYADLVKKEIEIMSQIYALGDSCINSIYFGGGTPSIMQVRFFQDILEFIHKNFRIAKEPEITIEINPESGSLDKLSELKSIGANRLSIGAQSFNDDVLRAAGRIHNKKEIFNAIDNARRAEFQNISLDLIIGLPGQTENILYDDLEQTLNIKPEHISAYMLSIEKGSKFYKIYNKKNGPAFISDENIAKYYELLCGLLNKNGYIQYEISNFSKKGYESRHNLNYWHRGEYLGLGPSASSFFKVKDGKEIRKTNISDINKYAEKILGNGIENKSSSDFFEDLTEKDKINEELFLSLRTNSGIEAKKLFELVGSDIIDSFIKEGLMENYNDNIILTLKGMLLSSEIFARIML